MDMSFTNRENISAWKRLWNTALTILALVFLVAYSLPAFIDDLSPNSNRAIDVIQWVSWLAFAIDLCVGLILAQNKKYFLKSNPLAIVSVLLPFLRPLRLLRFISFGTLVLDKVHLGKSVGISVRVITTALFLTYIAGVEITLAERGQPGSTIDSFGDGIWWAVTTLTTVGYGDIYPTTTQGRFIAIGLMVSGICVLGFVSATIAAWFVKLSNHDQTH
jgi:voltage-gated potassium channel